MGCTLMKPLPVNTRERMNELPPPPPPHQTLMPKLQQRRPFHKRPLLPNCLGIETHLMTIEHHLYCPACRHSTFPPPVMTAVGLFIKIIFDNATWIYLRFL